MTIRGTKKNSVSYDSLTLQYLGERKGKGETAAKGLDQIITMLENLDDSQYTDESWKDLETAVKEAKAVWANEHSSQKELDQALDALLKTFGNLEYAVQKVHLEVAVQTAEQLLAEAVNYEDMDALQMAVEEGKALLSNTAATQEEADQAVLIEKICFPPNEACSEKHMKERIGVTPELFLVAVDKTTGKLAGFLNGIATDEEKFRDEFFTDASLNNPKGKKVMILGLDVLPEYRGQGLAREIVRCYLQREEEKGRKEIVLTCLDEKVEMYKRFGFVDLGMSDSVWGGEEWHEMTYYLG